MLCHVIVCVFDICIISIGLARTAPAFGVPWTKKGSETLKEQGYPTAFIEVSAATEKLLFIFPG